MDDSTFDRLAKVLGATPTRRTGLSLAFGAAFGALTNLLPTDDAEARGKRNGEGRRKRATSEKKGQGKKAKGKTKGKGKGKGKGNGKKKTPPPPPPPPPPDAPTWKPCPRCSSCQLCNHSTGECVTDPSMEGVLCAGCNTCRNGACNVPDDRYCEEGQRCMPGVGVCCPVCQSDGSCCPVGSICINPGPFSANFCCETDFNDFCESNGDGTFRSCCPRETHVCLNDQCVRRGECPDGMKACPKRTGGSWCVPEDFTCCGNNACNTHQECCDASKDICCLKGICAGGKCCTGNREICEGQCCDFGKVCCGDTCCDPLSCINGQCCAGSVCGGIKADSRVCRTDAEFCCFGGGSGAEQNGYACPRGDGSQADCAPGGKCCPAGTIYNDSCDACCEDIIRVCGSQRCVPPTPGRFS
jgi:hypothetical protein